MPDVRAFHTGVEAAEQAAAAGDFTRAEALLREAADLQEAEVGPLHPDLASTFNNLAVVCEMVDKPADAEQFYRRAHAIAAATLGPGHALVTTSRDNLRDFCQARGLPLEEWAEVLPARPASPAGDTPGPVAAETAPVAAPTPRAWSAARPAASAASPARHSIRRTSLRAALVFVVLAVAAAARVWLTPAPRIDAAATPSAAPQPGPAPAATASAPAPAVPREPVATTPLPPPAAPRRPSPITAPGNDDSGPAGARVVRATVCRTLTPTGAWPCEPAGATTAPGSVAFYTRVASPRPMLVRHRWYQDDRLRQDVALRLGANAAQGYRTFSRRTVGPGEWRVELRAETGTLLDEVRFVVR